MSEQVVQTVHTLFERMLLGDMSFEGLGSSELEYAVRHAVDLLESAHEESVARRFELRLRLAMHLAPASAIAYDVMNPVPRHRLIRQFLEAEIGRSIGELDRLARDIASTLNAWDEARAAVRGYLPQLLREQSGRCAVCRVRLIPQPTTEFGADDFKPYHLAYEELLAPEVDHREAISCLGTNKPENLQAVCRLCNLGKGKGLGVELRDEIRWAGARIEEVPRHHRLTMLYYALSRGSGKCKACGDSVNELTVRRIREGGAFVRTNLQPVCYPCSQRSVGGM